MHSGNERRQVRVLIRAIFIFVILIAAFIAWVLFQPPPPLPKIAFQLNGYTNDFAGNRVAVLTISKLTKPPVLAYMQMVLTKDDPQPNGFSRTPRPILAWQAKLKFGQSAIVTIPTDTNPVTCRLGFFVYNV